MGSGASWNVTVCGSPPRENVTATVAPGARGLWRALCAAGVIGFGTAIGIHPIVGYNSFTHLLPAYAGALAFLVGIVLLRRPIYSAHEIGARFDDV